MRAIRMQRSNRVGVSPADKHFDPGMFGKKHRTPQRGHTPTRAARASTQARIRRSRPGDNEKAAE